MRAAPPAAAEGGRARAADGGCAVRPASFARGAAGERGAVGMGRRVFFGYYVAAALVLTSFIPLSLGLSCAGIFYPALSEELGVGTGLLGYYTSILWLSAMVLLPIMGNLLAKRDARLCVGGAVAIIAAAFVWLSFTRSLWQFYVGAVAMGAGVGMLLFLAPSTLINRWFAKRSGVLLGVVMAFTGVGGVVWSSVGGMLIQSVGWSATYLAFAVLSALTLPVAIFLVSSRPEDKGLSPFGAEETPLAAAEGSGDAAPAPSGIPAAQAFRMPVFFFVLAMCFMLNFGMYVYFMIPSYMSSLALSAAMPLLGATASSAAMAGQTVSKLVLGAVGERAPYAATVITLVLGVAGVALLFWGTGSAIALYAAAFVYGCFYGITNVMTPIITRRAFGDAEYPAIYSRVSMAASVGSVVSGFIWGASIEMTGGYTLMFAGVVAVMLLTMLSVRLIARAIRASSAK